MLIAPDLVKSVKSEMRKLLCLFSFVVAMFFANAQQYIGEYVQKLDGEWAFKIDPNDKGEREEWFKEGTDVSSWDKMAVPGNWDLRNEYSHYSGKAWYRISFTTRDISKEQVVRLLFEAVYHNSKVWLNGKLLGTNNSGFLPFEFDVSKQINFDKENSITVCADNGLRRGAIWNWGGIRRPVKLVATNTARIVGQRISSEINLNKKSAVVTIKLTIKNEAGQQTSLKGEVLLTNESGFQKALPFNRDVDAGTTTEVILSTVINGKQFHLWNCDDPFLYSSKVNIKNGTTILHESKAAFGLRKIEVDNVNYTFKLNGQPMRIMGFNLVPDDRTTGNTLPLWRVKEDVDLMKSMGGNLARLSHLPLHTEMFDYLDQKGILVFAEVPLWGYDQLVDRNNPLPKEWLARLISTHYNHPSIIGWSVGNEIGQVPGVNEYVSGAIKHAKELDSARLAVMVSHTASRTNNDPLQFSDMGLINGYGKAIGANADKVHGLYPNKLLFFTEYGYNQFTENLDGDLDAKAMMDSIRFKPYLMGGSLWTFNDYRSSYPGTKEFSENRAWGIVDVFRQKKKAWYSFQKEYAPVREFKVENVVTGSKAMATVSISPRKLLDLPAYTLDQYKLVWKVIAASGEVVSGGFKTLQRIQPGDATFSNAISWSMLENSYALTVSLSTPDNYNVIDTTIYFKKPSTPKIIYTAGFRTLMNNLGQNTAAMRIVFERNADACYHKLKYERNGKVKETPLTLNNYIDVSGLNVDDEYKLSLIAVNSFGESDPANTNLKIVTEYLPPIVLYTEPANNGFFVGYPSTDEDYRFEVQYTTKSGDYANAESLQTINKGVLFVPGLKNGQTYYYRMRSWKANNYISPWSNEIKVVPDGQQLPAPASILGIVKQGKDAMLFFQPQKKATGYTIDYRISGNDNWQQKTVNAAQINNYFLSGLDANKSHEFRMMTLNENGKSVYSEIKKSL